MLAVIIHKTYLLPETATKLKMAEENNSSEFVRLPMAISHGSSLQKHRQFAVGINFTSTLRHKKGRAPLPPLLTTPIKREITPTESIIAARRLIPLDESLFVSNDKVPVTVRTTPDGAVAKRKLKVDLLDMSADEDDNRLLATEAADISSKVWNHLKGEEIIHELELIRIQRKGLEKQGVTLAKIIREKADTDVPCTETDVDELIMQLFEVANEKNDLFRREDELLILDHQYNLEREQADLDYQIRLSMTQSDNNKTDSDKEKEDYLIAQYVQVVEKRNEVIECFEGDRLRELDEDINIKKSLELYFRTRLVQN